MMLPLRIAWRFLRRSPGQTILIVAGIAVGIGLQVFVGSLIASLQADLLGQVVGSSAHLTITAAEDGEPVELTSDLEASLGDERVTAIVAQRTISVLLTQDAETAPLSVKGAEPAALHSIYGLSDRLVQGAVPEARDDLLIGADLADEFGLITGDEIDVVLPGGETAMLTVSGIFDLGNAALNSSLAFSAEAFPRMVLDLGPDLYTAVELQVDDVFASTEIAGELGLEDVTVVDWQEQNADLLTALQSQSASSYLIQVFVVIAVALGIASTLAVSAIQKTRQIGILKALGMSDGRTGVVFLWQGAMLGTLGTAAGIGLALGLIAIFQQVSAGAEEALFPIEPQLGFIAISAVIGIGIAMASAIIPSRRTARLDPIEVIQNG